MRLALLLLALGGCAPYVALAPTPAQQARAQARWPEATPEALEQGRALFSARCANCHSLPHPDDWPPSAWPHQVEDMARRSHLTPEQQEAITRYLVTVSAP